MRSSIGFPRCSSRVDRTQFLVYPMPIPFVIDNQQRRLADALDELLAQSLGKLLDIATAYFTISGYRLLRQGLHQLGAFRLLLGSEPHTGPDVGLKPNAE